MRLLFALLLIGNTCFAQSTYPQGYFCWPVMAKKALAANFGELRSNHFHMGLDCKTEQRENIPVLAAADGYIAKVKIDATGFGRTLYINHPNGLTTLYAHLNDFKPDVEAYVKSKQYQLKQWNILIDIPKNLLPVTKGEIIAYSGNTGGSQGPHLHFEIRDTQSDKVLNPLLFGFPLADDIAPDVLKLVMYDRNKSTYEQTPQTIALQKQNGMYQASTILANSSKVSFAIAAHDRYNGSANPNGIYSAVIYDNGIERGRFIMDSINYDETRYLNAHIDYRLKNSGGPYVQHLSRLPGNASIIYKNGNGIIDLSDEKVHAIKIEVKDANNNTSVIACSIKGTAVEPAAINPDNYFQPGFMNVFENGEIRVAVGEKCLYDGVHFSYSAKEGIFNVLQSTIPAHTYFPVSIKNETIPDTGKVIMKKTGGNKEEYAKATFKQGWYTALFRSFGNFELIYDTIPPVISPISVKNNTIVFSITDNTKNITRFNPALNGKWILFSNDKGRTFIYRMDENCPVGNNSLSVVVEDLAGNRAERTINFTRQ